MSLPRPLEFPVETRLLNQLTVSSDPFLHEAPVLDTLQNRQSSPGSPPMDPWFSAYLEQTFLEFEKVEVHSWPKTVSWCRKEIVPGSASGERFGGAAFHYDLNCKLTLKNIRDNKLEIQLPGLKPEHRTLDLDLHLNL